MNGVKKVTVSIELPADIYDRFVEIAKQRTSTVERLVSEFADEIAGEVFHTDLGPLHRQFARMVISDKEHQIDIGGYLTRLLCDFIELGH
jgi:hypothetical protein